MRRIAPASRPPGQLGRADIHIHSAAGDGVNTIREILDFVEEKTDLDVIAITDHDEISGALEAKALVEQGGYSFEVITGSEISTRQGHVLALFIDQRLPMLHSVDETVAEVLALGGICVVPHPMSWLAPSVGERSLRRLCNREATAAGLCGLELFNPTVAGRVTSEHAAELNENCLHLSATGGSDSHHRDLIGTGVTLFPGHTAEHLRHALINRLTTCEGRQWSGSDHLHGVADQQLRAMVIHPYRKVMRSLSLRSKQ